MKPGHISVLVSYTDHFEVIEIDRDLETFQKLVGGYIEAVPRPTTDSGWFAYCNEEGKLEALPVNAASNVFIDRLYSEDGFAPFTSRDLLVGTIVWLTDSADDDGNEASIPVEYVQRYASVHLTAAYFSTSSTPVITVLRDGNDIWVFDQREGSLIPQHVAACVRAARAREEHGVIELWSGISPARWVELRVEIMDDIKINLHDERVDRSYG